MATVELQIPSRPEYVGVVRLAVASLARQAGMEEEAVDELRIALSEACTTAVMTHVEGGLSDPVCVGWSSEESHVVLEITSKTGGEPSPKAEASKESGPNTMSLAARLIMSQALLESLATQVQLERTDDSTTTRLTFSL